MHTELDFEGDDTDTPMSNIVSLRPAGEPVSIGSLAAVVISDLSVRLSGEFQLPRLRVARSTSREEDAN